MKVLKKTQKDNRKGPKPAPPLARKELNNMMLLQQTIGNRAVQRLYNAGLIQPKLKIGSPGDIYEQEAERVSEQVMRMTDEDIVQRKPG